MDVQVLGVATAGLLAFVAELGQDCSSGCRGDGGVIALTGVADLAVALGLFQLCG